MKSFAFALLLTCFIGSSLDAATVLPTPNKGEQEMLSSLEDLLPDVDVILAAGTAGCEALKKAPPEGSRNVLLTWQWLDAMKDLAPGTVVVIPTHAIDARIQGLAKAKPLILIPIQGVLHGKTLDKVRKAEDLVKSLALPTRPKMIVMLGGHAQQEDGSWKAYTPEAADQDLFAHLPKGKVILFLGGPRTDRGVPADADSITKRLGQHKNKNWILKDSQGPTWDAVLRYCLENKDVILVLPSESTSMISAALSLGIVPRIAHNPAMTATSARYVDQLVRAKQAVLFSPEADKEPLRATPIPPQGNVVAAELLKLKRPAP